MQIFTILAKHLGLSARRSRKQGFSRRDPTDMQYGRNLFTRSLQDQIFHFELPVFPDKRSYSVSGI